MLASLPGLRSAPAFLFYKYTLSQMTQPCFPSGFTTRTQAVVQGKVQGVVLHHVKTMSFVLLGTLTPSSRNAPAGEAKLSTGHPPRVAGHGPLQGATCTELQQTCGMLPGQALQQLSTNTAVGVKDTDSIYCNLKQN